MHLRASTGLSALFATARTLLRRAGASPSGSVAVEFALLSPILILLLLAAIDFGSVIFERMRLESAARAGAQYAMSSSFDITDLAGVQTAAETASGIDVNAVTVTPTLFCECGVSTVVACGTTCAAGGAPPRTYLDLSVVETYGTMLPYPGLPDSMTLTGQSVMRIR